MTFNEYELGDLITLKRGYDLPNHARHHGDVPVVSSAGISGFHADSKVKGPGVVTGRYGTIGEVHYIIKDFWPLNTTLYVQNFKGNYPRFIAYLLKTLDLASHNAAAAVPGVNRNDLHRLKVFCPPLPIQRRIASILSAYDDLIENNTRRIAILEEMARRIYEEWFVKFKFPGHEKVKMVDSELGKIPEEWKVCLLGDVIELAYGKALKTENRKAGDFPVYGSSGIVGYHSDYLIEGPGIIVGRKGNVGSVHWSDKSFFPIDTVFYVKTNLSLYYLFFNLKMQNFINNDAAVPGLNRNQAHSLPFIKPSDVIIELFNKICEQIFGLLRILTVKNTNLRTTRDFLLPKLISGEIDVSKLPESEDAAA